MIITNKYGLPEQVRRACAVQSHRQGDYSVTQLLKGSKEIAMEKLLGNILEDDCIDRFWALFGTAVHKVLENEVVDGVHNEVFMEVEIAGKTVTGTADVIDMKNGIIKDYKTCSRWKFVFNDFSDWRDQIKGYLYLVYAKYKLLWTKGEIVAVLRDWSQTDAKRDVTYPQKPIMTVPFTYTEEEIKAVGEEWETKINDVENCLSWIIKSGESSCPCCSDEETWTKPTTYAVMKEGRKTAVRVFESEEEANTFAATDKTYSVIKREGGHTKCENYCIIAKNGYCRGRKVADEQ